jgi:peptidoglycan hydrolase CwlO-like protein
MNDLNLSSIASSLETIASEIGNLVCIEDSIDKLAEDVRDLNQSLDFLNDKIGEIHESINSQRNI